MSVDLGTEIHVTFDPGSVRAAMVVINQPNPGFARPRTERRQCFATR
ncbi:hypothetical protein H3V53_34910 [Paraburkholderia bengalensis]|uniref:Uncharacterized protein n=1 Tax=Paraburkholderia bengalensis TaxID=2747562 RepID=A0ABU8J3N8_9BURK